MNEPVIHADDVSVCFGDHRALEHVTLEIRQGDFVAVLGPNGSGKSTLLKTLLGLVPPTTGQLAVFGRKPGAADPGRIGYVPQVKTLDRSFPARSVELVLTAVHRRWPGRIRASDRTRALQALEDVGAAHLADRPLSGLSGGELQRVYLARSLIRTPRLVMLDEPATGIDVVGTADLYNLLDAYQQRNGATILMVTHDLNVAYHHASSVLLLSGTQVAFGPPEEALTDECLRKAFGHVGHAHAMIHTEHDSH